MTNSFVTTEYTAAQDLVIVRLLLGLMTYQLPAAGIDVRAHDGRPLSRPARPGDRGAAGIDPRAALDAIGVELVPPDAVAEVVMLPSHVPQLVPPELACDAAIEIVLVDGKRQLSCSKFNSTMTTERKWSSGRRTKYSRS